MLHPLALPRAPRDNIGAKTEQSAVILEKLVRGLDPMEASHRRVGELRVLLEGDQELRQRNLLVEVVLVDYRIAGNLAESLQGCRILRALGQWRPAAVPLPSIWRVVGRVLRPLTPHVRLRIDFSEAHRRRLPSSVLIVRQIALRDNRLILENTFLSKSLILAGHVSCSNRGVLLRCRRVASCF